jgi:hypothetical protein
LRLKDLATLQVLQNQPSGAGFSMLVSKELARQRWQASKIGLHVLLIKELGKKAPQKAKNASERLAQRREYVISLRKSIYVR